VLEHLPIPKHRERIGFTMSTNEHIEKPDVYRRVTDAIINAIEQGVCNWRMPWHTSGRFAFSPINVTSKKPYRGINTLCLWAAAQAKGYERGEWATYNQWQERGAQVRKGEKATTVVFWKFANSSAETQDDGEEHTVSSSRLLFTRGYSVFNVAQVDGYTPKTDSDAPIEQRIESAEQFFARINARVVHQGNRAFYSPDTDAITLPPFAAFFTAIDYYSTRAHETGHNADFRIMPRLTLQPRESRDIPMRLLGIITAPPGKQAGHRPGDTVQVWTREQ
jgi:antirestriction protein ArdC